MVSRKQRFRTALLVLFLTAVIVGGVFGISYYKGGVTFPWQVASYTKQAKADKPAKNKAKEPKLVVKEKASKEKAEDKSVEEQPKEEPAAANAAKTTGKLGYYGALSVSNGQLVDANGKNVQLTGVSSHGINWFPEFITPEAIKSLRDNWGINVIRLAMYTSDYNGYCVGGADNQQALKNKIDDAVKAATDNEMYVIIDWHILNDNNPNQYKSEAIQFFGEMVRKYRSNENVIYEICNEPNGDTTWSDIKTYANEVIPVIRNVDSDAIILVGTPRWSSDLDAVAESPLEFDNIMYAFHFYGATHKSSYRNTLTNALDEGLPVFISEYGYVGADGNGEVDQKEAEKWDDVIDEYGLSSCIWNLSNKDEGSALIVSGSDKKSDYPYEDLTAQGQYFFNKLNNLNMENTDNDN